MTIDFVTRRDALKFAGLISMAAISGLWTSGRAVARRTRGYGSDPDLSTRIVTWQRTLHSAQLSTLRILADIILPADPPHPSAGAIGVHEFVDEWLSAPYPQMEDDRGVILRGLEQLDDATLLSVGSRFAQAEPAHQAAAFDQMCSVSSGPATFVPRLIELVCGGYYTTREGHAAIGYIGNVALTSFRGTVPEAEKQLAHSLNALLETPPDALRA